MNKHTSNKTKGRIRRKRRVRKTLHGTKERPRLTVFRSNQHLYVQIIDDDRGVTLASASTMEKEVKGKFKSNNKEAATHIGKRIAERAKAQAIEMVCFDRGGYLFHGRIKALADSARESGLVF